LIVLSSIISIFKEYNHIPEITYNVSHSPLSASQSITISFVTTLSKMPLVFIKNHFFLKKKKKTHREREIDPITENKEQII
jgi:hypothetical protein